jgi:PAS domain S-box-containing protein
VLPSDTRSALDDELRLIVETSADLICVTGMDGVFRFVNPAFETILGYDPESLIGVQSLDLIHPDDAPAAVEAVRDQDRATGIAFRFRHAHGHWVHAEMSRSLTFDRTGQPSSAIIVARDVSERKAAEERFRCLADHSPTGIYILQDGKLQYVNPHYQRCTGYTEDELLGTDAMLLVLPEDRAAVRRSAVRMLKGQRAADYEYRVINKAGEVRWVMERVAFIEHAGRRASLGHIVDITDRKTAEAG